MNDKGAKNGTRWVKNNNNKQRRSRIRIEVSNMLGGCSNAMGVVEMG